MHGGDGRDILERSVRMLRALTWSFQILRKMIQTSLSRVNIHCEILLHLDGGQSIPGSENFTSEQLLDLYTWLQNKVENWKLIKTKTAERSVYCAVTAVWRLCIALRAPCAPTSHQNFWKFHSAGGRNWLRKMCEDRKEPVRWHLTEHPRNREVGTRRNFYMLVLYFYFVSYTWVALPQRTLHRSHVQNRRRPQFSFQVEETITKWLISTIL